MAKEEKTSMKFTFKFNGDYLAFFGWNILWSVVTMVTVGIAAPFYIMWFIKYVVENIEVEMVK